MVRFSRIGCAYQNHKAMPIQFACLNSSCISYGRSLCCLYCCDEYHKNHKNCIVTIKEILVELEAKAQKTEYNILQTLLGGMETCQNFQELKTNFAQLLSYRHNPQRYEKILDQEMQSLQAKTVCHYQRIHQRQTARSLHQKSTVISKSMITPVLTFKEHSSYALESLFTVSNPSNQLVTAFAYPSLSKFHDSISITIRIDTCTPSWIGIGLSVGENKYEEKSTKHLLAISNGWISRYGQLQRSKVRFRGGDSVRLRWDKERQLLQVQCRGEREAREAVCRWNEQVYLCVCLFYRGDRVSILS